jgi:hypothetical protein
MHKNAKAVKEGLVLFLSASLRVFSAKVDGTAYRENLIIDIFRMN